jgi:hypothetical protein
VSEVSEEEFVAFCRANGLCNVDIERDCEVSVALDVLSRWFFEHPDGCVPTLRDAYRQIEKIHQITI